MSRTHKIAIAAGFWLALGGLVAAQTYPTQPVRFVVPYAAGGGTDAMARFFSKGLEARFGQPFIVENRPGSGTTIGANFVAKSPPDGQTILLGHVIDLRDRGRPLQEAALQSGDGLRADRAGGGRAVRADRASVAAGAFGRRPGEIPEGQPGIQLRLRRRRLAASRQCRAVPLAGRARHQERQLSRRRSGGGRTWSPAM